MKTTTQKQAITSFNIGWKMPLIVLICIFWYFCTHRTGIHSSTLSQADYLLALGKTLNLVGLVFVVYVMIRGGLHLGKATSNLGNKIIGIDAEGKVVGDKSLTLIGHPVLLVAMIVSAFTAPYVTAMLYAGFWWWKRSKLKAARWEKREPQVVHERQGLFFYNRMNEAIAAYLQSEGRSDRYRQPLMDEVMRTVGDYTMWLFKDGQKLQWIDVDDVFSEADTKRMNKMITGVMTKHGHTFGEAQALYN